MTGWFIEKLNLSPVSYNVICMYNELTELVIQIFLKTLFSIVCLVRNKYLCTDGLVEEAMQVVVNSFAAPSSILDIHMICISLRYNIFI